MADNVNIQTRKITREQIAAWVGSNPRAIKLIEALTEDIISTLPDAIDEVQLSAMFSLHGADGSKQASQTAFHGILEMQALVQANQRALGCMNELRAEVDLLRLELHDARNHLLSAIQQAQRAASDALALVAGV